jgi:hypothetical protein
VQIHVGSKHLVADVAVALDVAGREHLVVVAKASWRIPEPGQRPRPIAPEPLVMADDYLGEPGASPMRYGADMARLKPRCDVIFDACAHVPFGQAKTQLLAGFQIGEPGQRNFMRKLLRVHGRRRWQRAVGGLAGYRLSAAEPFLSVPLHYGLALGGSRLYERAGQRWCQAHLHNPVGLGWAGKETIGQLHDQPAPQLEHPDEPVLQPDARCLPQALSAVGRHWLPRRQWAGTYDDAWRQDVFPLLPPDFDEQFHQCAPLDQQMAYPQGGETVRLFHLLPDHPELMFALPRLQQQVRVRRSNYATEAPVACLDTLFFETERGRFSAVWRASVPIRRSLQEIAEVAVGPIDPLWWRDRVMGKGGCVGCGPIDQDHAERLKEPGLA